MTEKLYYADSRLLEFDARVVSVTERDGRAEITLDRTCFFPGGGGQPCDTGTLGGARVLEVDDRGEEIVHVAASAPGAGPGATVHGVVDADRRADYTAQHTGQHIFSQALVRGAGLETVSVHFGEEDTTIELAAESVADSKLRAAEDAANAVIKENRRVILHEVDKSEASRFPLRRTPPDAGRLRIVEVEGFDWAACGGVHVASAGEVFLVKAVGLERIRGRVRVHVMMGRRALDDYGRKVALVQDLTRMLTCGEPVLFDRIRELAAREKDTARELRRYRLAQAEAEADESVAAATQVGPVLCVRRLFDDAGPEYLKAFVERALAVPGRIAIAMDKGTDGFQWIVAHSLGSDLDLAALLQPLLPAAGAKGGGRGARMQGVGSRADAAGPFADAVEQALSRRIR